MSETTSRLSLPLLAPAQAQKHVTHNEALVMLDAIVHLAVAERRAAPPPGAPEGSRYIVASPATAEFAGREGNIAVLQDGAWSFFPPDEGWIAWVRADAVALVFRDGFWADLKPRVADVLGVSTVADPVNRLAVSSDAILFTHAGSDCRVKLNKASASATSSLTFQTAYAGRAELGLAGDDRFRLKASPDGSNWSDILVADPASGNVGLGTDHPTTKLQVDGPVRVKAYPVAGLPAASAGAGAIVFVNDDAGGAVLAFSDGASWRRVTDRAVVA